MERFSASNRFVDRCFKFWSREQTSEQMRARTAYLRVVVLCSSSSSSSMHTELRYIYFFVLRMEPKLLCAPDSYLSTMYWFTSFFSICSCVRVCISYSFDFFFLNIIFFSHFVSTKNTRGRWITTTWNQLNTEHWIPNWKSGWASVAASNGHVSRMISSFNVHIDSIICIHFVFILCVLWDSFRMFRI